MPFLSVENLSVRYPLTEGLFRRVKGYVHAVIEASFELEQRGIFSLIGESGSGKTTLANAVLGLVKPSEGSVTLSGMGLDGYAGKGLVQAVFQNPYGSQNPRMTVFDIVSEPLTAQKRIPRGELKKTVDSLLESVGMDPSYSARYPHEFSGGQRQRVSIARALASSPGLIVLDEPVSSLDVSIRSQILNLLKELQENRGLSYLYISHDLSTVRYLSGGLAIMYRGRILERGGVDSVFDNPKSPYTRLLLESARGIITGGAPETGPSSASGCPFVSRCPDRLHECSLMFPKKTTVTEGHDVWCHAAR